MDTIHLGELLEKYCKAFAIPIDHVFDILNDQKVVPMIRGKATEYAGYLVLKQTLGVEWSVEKLNLNAQPNLSDEDISVTHRRTGIILKVECKNGVRGSMTLGQRTRVVKVPHCKIKCHRSRSNISLAGSSNDRYAVDVFDLILTNLSNAIIQGKTIGPELELLYDRDTIAHLQLHYDVTTDDELRAAAANDWRFVFPHSIAVDGFLPRTPYMLLADDPNWRPLGELASGLTELVRDMLKKGQRRPRG